MAYEPTVWKDGDVISAAKLNKIENGVAAGGGLPEVHIDFTISDNEIVPSVRESYSDLYELLGGKFSTPVCVNNYMIGIPDSDDRVEAHLGEIVFLDNGLVQVQTSSAYFDEYSGYIAYIAVNVAEGGGQNAFHYSGYLQANTDA